MFISNQEVIGGTLQQAYSILYREKSETQWIKYSGTSAPGEGTGSSHITINLSGDDRPVGMAIWFDNVEVHSGLYFSELALTDESGNVIDAEKPILETATELMVTGEL